jgi:2-hydroxychromene-2-carboxylate isomerase
VLTLAAAPETKEAFKQQAEQALAHGIFGAPSFVVEDELFWGDDRLEDAIAFAASKA